MLAVGDTLLPYQTSTKQASVPSTGMLVLLVETMAKKMRIHICESAPFCEETMLSA